MFSARNMIFNLISVKAPTLDLGTSTLDHGSVEEAWSDDTRFVINHADGRVRICRLPGERLLPQCTASHTQAGVCGTMFWGTFSWASLGPGLVVEQTLYATEYLKIIVGQLHLYSLSVFPTGNGMFQEDNVSCHKARIVLEWFQEHDAEFQLMSWLPKLPNLKPIEDILNVMELQLRVQIPPFPNISDLFDHCLNMWYNLSSAINQRFVVPTPRLIIVVLPPKCEQTCYLQVVIMF